MMNINEALRTILHTTRNIANCENIDMREFDPHMPAVRRNVLIEYCSVCDTILRAWYVEDEMIDYDHPFYVCDTWEHSVIHNDYVERQHSYYEMDGEYDANWDYENDQSYDMI